MTGYTLDAGALIALERGDARMRSIVVEAARRGQEIRVPAVVVAQVWRDPARQATLARFLSKPLVQHVPVDVLMAKVVGMLCSATATNDVVDAAVAVCARLHDDDVLTSDPVDMARLVRPDRVVAI